MDLSAFWKRFWKMRIAMKMLRYPAVYTKDICLVTWDKSKIMNGLEMHSAFQTSSRASNYHFLCSSLSTELQHTCFFAEHIMLMWHRISPMLETWDERFSPLSRIRCRYCTELWASAALNGSLLWSWLIARARSSPNSGNLNKVLHDVCMPLLTVSNLSAASLLGQQGLSRHGQSGEKVMTGHWSQPVCQLCDAVLRALPSCWVSWLWPSSNLC